MAKKEVIIVPGAESHLYSSAVRAGDYVFLSGQVGFLDDKGREIKGIEAQTRQCLENMKQVLQTAGSSLSDVVRVTIFLAKVDDFGKMNEVYRNYFTEDLPARATVITGLVQAEMLVEMECIACKA